LYQELLDSLLGNAIFLPDALKQVHLENHQNKRAFAVTFRSLFCLFSKINPRNYLAQLTEQTLSDIYRSYSPDICRYAFSILKDRESAKDAMQEVFLKFADTFRQYEGKCSIKTWLLILTRNYCYNRIKSKGYMHCDIEEIDSVSAVSPDTELILSLEDALKRLPAAQNELLYLKDAAGYSYKEIADMTGLSIENVKVKIFRVRTILRSYLKDEL
jgi:RNA polymerase sigma-70 factor (ECF subfamily)